MLSINQSPHARRLPVAVGHIVVLLALLVLLPTPSSAGSELANVWHGKYFYPEGSGRSPVVFELKVTSVQDGNFTGRTTEPATFGTKPCSFLYANVKGNIEGDRITFTKTYDGTCGQTHSVSYSGILENPRTMEGNWSVSPTFGGAFTANAGDSK
jgi:hypothetical protein